MVVFTVIANCNLQNYNYFKYALISHMKLMLIRICFSNVEKIMVYVLWLTENYY